MFYCIHEYSFYSVAYVQVFHGYSKTMKKLIINWCDSDNSNCERWIQETEARALKTLVQYTNVEKQCFLNNSQLNSQLGEQIVTLVDNVRCYALYLSYVSALALTTFKTKTIV